VTSTAPYLIIIALFIRGITLKGAGVGVYHFLGKPDMTKLLKRETWIAALVQTCYAMEVGYGGILTMASYNRRSNNCYRSGFYWFTVYDSFAGSSSACFIITLELILFIYVYELVECAWVLEKKELAHFVAGGSATKTSDPDY
ncbi:hypothetical protein TELCIR_16576, partial [Teladorsagia circumcincta]